jgi:hypothetical protein
MKKSIVSFAVLAVTLFAMHGTARAADTCIELTGPSCPVDGFGFLRFKGKLPKAGKIVPIHGRFCGFGSATGTAVAHPEGFMMEIGVNFFCDAEQGQFEIFWDLEPGMPIVPTAGYGYAAYGEYGVFNSCDAAIVDCSNEPL